MNVIKYLYPPLVLTIMGPHTSVCMRLKRSEAHSPFLVNGDLVILPRRHNSQVDNDSQSLISKISYWVNVAQVATQEGGELGLLVNLI